MNPLDEIQARADAATEGPWDTSPLGEVYSGTGMSNDPLVADEAFKADAEFIAHAREDVPKLVGALRAVEVMCGAPEHHETQGPHNGYVTLDNLLGAINEALG